MEESRVVSSNKVIRIAIDFSNGSRAIIERIGSGELMQEGNIKLDEGSIRSLGWLIKGIEDKY